MMSTIDGRLHIIETVGVQCGVKVRTYVIELRIMSWNNQAKGWWLLFYIFFMNVLVFLLFSFSVSKLNAPLALSQR